MCIRLLYCAVGKAESLSVGVSSIENCSERDHAKALNADDTRGSPGKEKAGASCTALELSDDGLEDDCIYQNNLGHITATFDNSNPHQEAHKKVTVKNMRCVSIHVCTLYMCNR